MDGNGLDIYWFLRRQVIEIPILELITAYAAPWGCPVLYFYADEEDISDALYADHGMQRPEHYTGSSWDDGPPDPGDPPGFVWGGPSDNAAELAALFALLSDDEEEEEEAAAEDAHGDEDDDCGSALSDDPIEDA